MAKTGQVEFIYAHLQSLRNLEQVVTHTRGTGKGHVGESWDELVESDSETHIPIH